MKIARNVGLALALAAPAAASAQHTPAQGTQTPEGAQQHGARSTESAQMQREAAIKGYVLPAVAGVESAEKSAAALHELAMTQPFERKDARQTAQLATEAVRVAHEGAEGLRNMKDLSPQARSEAENAAQKLTEARASVKRIREQVGAVEGPFRRDEAEKVRADAARLHAELSEAEHSLDRVASVYRISTNLEEPERMPVRGTER